MKNILKFVVLFSLGMSSAFAITGKEIALMVDKQDTSDNAKRSAVMVIERGTEKLVRKMNMDILKEDNGNIRHSLINFIAPKDIQDTKFLSRSYADISKNNDLWVFLPTESLVRRISGGGRKNAFMRSDFALEDIDYRSVDLDEHNFIKEDKVNDRAVWIIESTPLASKANETGYSKRIVYVDQEYKSPVKIEYYGKNKKHIKTMLAGAWKNIANIWTPTKLIMQKEGESGRTLLQYTDVVYNAELDKAIFDQGSLKR